MIIDRIHISHFRSYKDCTIELTPIQSIVGRNNVGKSNLLKAIRLFMEASKRLLDEECFHHHDTSRPISICLEFTNLKDWEREHFSEWMYDEERLIVERQFEAEGTGDYSIDRIAILREPEPDWLKQSKISGDNIDKWLEKESELKVEDLDFSETLDSNSPLVGAWEDKAQSFVNEHRDKIPFEEVRRKNPSGFKKVLRNGLPEFIHVPAISDVTEESKIKKSNPFGRLVNSTLKRVDRSKMEKVTNRVEELGKLLNRSDERLPAIETVEDDLNELMQDLSNIEVEIEVDVPDLEELLGTSELFAHGSTRTPIEDKGHGLQRSMVFTILRAYSNLISEQMEEESATKTTIFGFEEPEIYQHPQSQRTLLSVFRNIVQEGNQIIYTTHSSHFVNVNRFDEVCIMRKNGGSESARTRPQQLTMNEMLEDLKARQGIEGSISGIRNLYANAFDVEISEGFFADKVVLVEGRSEKYILPIYARLLGYDFDRNNVAVVRAGGKGPLDRLLRIFTGFDIPTYLIFDGDKNSNDSEIKDKSVELIDLMGYELGDIGNLEDMIKDTYAVWGEDLESILEDEIDQYQHYCREVRDQWGPVGKALRHRFMATQIENRVQEDGVEPTDAIPPSMQELIQKIRGLSKSVDVLVTE